MSDIAFLCRDERFEILENKILNLIRKGDGVHNEGTVNKNRITFRYIGS